MPRGVKTKVKKKQQAAAKAKVKVKPKKISKKPAKSSKVAKVAKVPKKRGRPPKPKSKTEVVKKKRGRPPKSADQKTASNSKTIGYGYKAYTEPDDYVPPKSHKFLGYCPKAGCNSMISSLDLVSKNIFVCRVCGKRDRISKLKKQRKSKNPLPTSKRDFLNETNLQLSSTEYDS